MTQTGKGKSSNTLGTVERALDVLLLFGRHGVDSLGVTQVSRELDLPKAVVHRIVTTLASRDFLTSDTETRRYRLGPAWLTLGSAYLENFDIREFARPTLHHLSASSNETATLSVRHGESQRIYLDQITPPREVKMSVQVGAAYPLHAGGSSKALLAFLPEPEQEAYLSEEQLTRLTEITITDVAALRKELALTRQRGYAVSLGERQSGAGTVAAPVLNHHAEPVAVISICGPVDRIATHVEDFAANLTEATNELSRRMGFTGPDA